MAGEQWRVEPGTEVAFSAYDPAQTGEFQTKAQADAAMTADLLRLRDLQELLYADDRYAVLLVLQGMDTSGKDGTVKYLSSGVSLVGAEMTNFKKPSVEELAHDFLWRVHQRAPARGRIGIFNRSHYEDVLIVRVHHLVPASVWEQRYEQINAFERILTLNNTIILKCFLHISGQEQKERLLARLRNPSKLWKFTHGDIRERRYWNDYEEAYEAALSRCSTAEAPWHIIPANKKWYRNYAVTRLLVQTLEELDLALPKPDFNPQDVRFE